MRYALRSTFIALTALIVTALLAPAAATAAELPLASATTTSTPTIAELTAESTEAAMAESKLVNTLEWHDARIDAAIATTRAFFDTLGAPLVAGATWSAAEDAGAPVQSVVVNRALAERL